MEIGSGFIGLKQYLGRISSATSLRWQLNAIILALTLLLSFCCFIAALGRSASITVCSWIGTMVTVGAVIVGAVGHFDPKIAFSLPPKAFDFSLGFVSGLGARPASAFMITSAITTSATSARKCAIPAGSSRAPSSAAWPSSPSFI